MSLVLAASALLGVSAAQAATSTSQAPTGFFVPTDAQKYDSPYYRDANGDWGWTQPAITGTITTASLNVSAFDVDFSSGEVDNVYAYDNGVKTLLGNLAGGNDIYSFTTFTLGSNFFDDINAGLQVFVDIDTLNGGWELTLAKSVITTDGGILPPPLPGVPEPATWAMMLVGVAGLGAALRSTRRIVRATA